MHRYFSAYCQLLDQNNIRYRKEDGYIVVRYSADSNRSYEFAVFFPDEDDVKRLTILCRVCDAPFNGDKYAKALVLCNNYNSDRAFSKLYVNKDKLVFVQYDFVLQDIKNISDITELIIMLGRGIDEIYPDFMRIMWA